MEIKQNTFAIWIVYHKTNSFYFCNTFSVWSEKMEKEVRRWWERGWLNKHTVEWNGTQNNNNNSKTKEKFYVRDWNISLKKMYISKYISLIYLEMKGFICTLSYYWFKFLKYVKIYYVSIDVTLISTHKLNKKIISKAILNCNSNIIHIFLQFFHFFRSCCSC